MTPESIQQRNNKHPIYEENGNKILRKDFNYVRALCWNIGFHTEGAFKKYNGIKVNCMRFNWIYKNLPNEGGFKNEGSTMGSKSFRPEIFPTFRNINLPISLFYNFSIYILKYIVDVWNSIRSETFIALVDQCQDVLRK